MALRGVEDRAPALVADGELVEENRVAAFQPRLELVVIEGEDHRGPGLLLPKVFFSPGAITTIWGRSPSGGISDPTETVMVRLSAS